MPVCILGSLIQLIGFDFFGLYFISFLLKINLKIFLDLLFNINILGLSVLKIFVHLFLSFFLFFACINLKEMKQRDIFFMSSSF